MTFKQLAAQRYSCRKFSDKTVSVEKIDRIIETTKLAPTAVNQQPYQIFVMHSEKANATVKEASPYTYGAECFLVVGYKTSEAWTREFDQRNFGDVDASIVATHLMMAIYDEGLATTWVGHFNAPLLQKTFPKMKDYDLIALFPIGYAAADAAPAQRHYERKSTAELVTVL